MQDIELRRNSADHLHFRHRALHIGKTLFQQQFAVIHDTDMVAHVFQFAQVVARHEHRHFALCDFREQNAPNLTAHDGVKPVHRFVQNQHIRLTADGQMERRLLLHTFGKTANLSFLRQVENLLEFGEEYIVKRRIHALVKAAHFFNGSGGKVEDVVGNVADAAFDARVFEDGLAVEGDGAAVGHVHARQMANGGGFTGTVRADEAVYRALGDGEGQVVQSGKASERFGDVFHFKHGFVLLLSVCR